MNQQPRFTHPLDSRFEKLLGNNYGVDLLWDARTLGAH
jgi:hypothetical protein